MGIGRSRIAFCWGSETHNGAARNARLCGACALVLFFRHVRGLRGRMADQTAEAGINRGLLWGCIAPLVAVIFLIAGWFVYNTYYYTAGYKEAPGLPTVMHAVNASPIAKKILGDDIQIVQMELNMSGGARKGGQRI